ALVAAKRARCADPDGLVEARATLQLDRSVDLEVCALDRVAEGFVEEALDVPRVLAPAAGGQHESGEEQYGQGAAHPPQSSWKGPQLGTGRGVGSTNGVREK